MIKCCPSVLLIVNRIDAIENNRGGPKKKTPDFGPKYDEWMKSILGDR